MDFNFLEAGYIKNYSYTGSTDDLVAISDDGKMFLNQSKPVYERYIKIITCVMSMSDRQLKSRTGYYDFFKKFVANDRRVSNKTIVIFLAQNKCDAIESMYNDIRQWELKRRELKKNRRKG